MKIYGFTIIFAAGIFLFTACEDARVKNTVSDEKKTVENKTVDNQNAVDNSNTVINKISDAAVNSETKTSENSDFKGTAGITDKKYEAKSAAILKEVRTAQHNDYDRVAFEFEGAEMPSYHIEYIDKPVRACGSGNVVELKGEGWLEIRFYPANAHNQDGEPTVKNRELAPNHKIINQLKLTCDFEADVTWVLGVLSPNKYRVLELKNPTRLAVDIKH